MSNFILSAELVLKDKMTDGLKKTEYALFGIAGEALKVTKSTDTMKRSLSGIKGDYQVSLSIKDRITSNALKIKSLLNDFKNKDYSSIISIKDGASLKIAKVKSELTGLAGRAITTYVNVKTNMPNGGFNLNNKINNFADGMLMGTSMQMAGAAGIGYTAYDTIKTSMDFDYQLSAIKSLIPKEGQDGQSRDEIMSQIRERAMQLGQDTVFGNTDVARGMTELVKAGVQLKDVLGDASEAALNLATAGGLELAEAAETMSTAMNAFKVTDATHAADILAGAANASATDVHELRYALSMCSAVASGAGVSFEDANTTLAVFAQNGLKGSDAGTSLKTMLSNLIPKTKTQVEAFSKLNLLTEKGTSAFFDQQGKVKSLAEIAGLLQDRLKGMTKEEQMSTLYDMFGSDAIRGGMILMREGAEGVTKMFEEMSKVTAKEMALTQLDNLKGDIEELSGAWENFQITLMSGNGTSGLRGFTQELTELIKLGTNGLKDGFGFRDVFSLINKGITDLTNKFIAFDGIGSLLAGGALFLGLKKIYSLSTSVVSKIKDIIKSTKNLPNDLPTNLPDSKTTKDMIVTAQNVYINGKSPPGDNTPVPNEPTKSPNEKQPNEPSNKSNVWTKVKDTLKTGWNYGGNISKAGIALTIPFTAYDIYSADEGEKGAAIARAGGGIAGGWAGAKIGGATGAAIGSILPGIGTGAGAIIGGAIGGIGGGILGSQFADSISRLFDFSAKDNIINRINNSSWGQAQNMANQTQIALPQMQYDSTMTNFSGIGDNVQNISDMQFQSSQIQIEGQKQAFSEFKDFVSNIWNEITDTTNAAGQMQLESSQIQTEGQMQLLSGLRDFATEIWNSIQQAGISAWENIQAKWNEAVSWFSSNICSPLENLAQNAGTGIATGINSAIATIQGAWQGLVNWFEVNVFGPIKQKYLELKSMAPSPVQTVLNFVDGGLNIGHNATGTMNWKGGLTEINERGGEIVDLPMGSRIYPAQTTERIIQHELKSTYLNQNTNLNTEGNFVLGAVDFDTGLSKFNQNNKNFIDFPIGISKIQTTENIIKNEAQDNGIEPIKFNDNLPVETTNEYAIQIPKYEQQNASNTPAKASTTTGGNITITGNTFVIRNEQDIDEIAYRLMSLMRQVDANYGGAY